MIKRATVTSDLYQESHLDTMGVGWSRTGYIFLALFTACLSAIIYLQRIVIIDIPLLGWVGYSFFQTMTLGVFIFSLYFTLWSKKKGKIEQSPVSFSWLGFWLRDFFMAAVFFHLL